MKVVDLNSFINIRPIDNNAYNMDSLGGFMFVHVYNSGKVIEAEFVAAEGKTVAALTLNANDVRSMARSEILHVRGFAAA